MPTDETGGGHYHRKLATVTTAVATGTATVVTDIPYCVSAMFKLDVTAAGTAAADTLNVRIQKTPDNGTTWCDVVSFTQVVGNGGAVSETADWCTFVTPDDEIAITDGTLAAANVNQGGLLGPQLRVKYTIVDDTTPTFTFTVMALFGGGRQP